MACPKEIFILFLISLDHFKCVSEKITYMSVEHPRITYYNPKFLSYVNLTCRRYGRKNPVYYVDIHFTSIVPIDNNLLVDIYIYEWLTNVYKRSFIEFHYAWCNLLENDKIFGSALRQGGLRNPCPHKPDQYHLVNMTANPAAIPPGFPFTRGRIYANFTRAKTHERVVEGYIDMRIEQLNGKDAKKLLSS